MLDVQSQPPMQVARWSLVVPKVLEAIGEESMTPEQQQSCDKAILCCRRAIKASEEMQDAMSRAEQALLELPGCKDRDDIICTFEDYAEECLSLALEQLLLMKKEK